MSIKVPDNIYCNALPDTYRWIGNDGGAWEDPKNWLPAATPNHPEATVIFEDLDLDTCRVTIKSQIVLANIWFNSKRTSYRIDSEDSPDTLHDGRGIFFSTGQQLANIVLTEKNTANHQVLVLIMHSCKKLYGPGWALKSIPFSQTHGTIERKDPVSKITFSGPIGSYKDAPRASLNLDGDIEVELSGDNSFVGPIDIRRGVLNVARSESIPSNSVLHVYSPARIALQKGVEISLRELHINGVAIKPGRYTASDVLFDLSSLGSECGEIIVLGD